MQEIPKFQKPRNNRFILQVTGTQNGDFAGRITEVLTGETTGFTSFAHMLLLLEGILDESNFPQRALTKRSFGKELPVITQTPTLAKGDATFELGIIFRQNGSWQGDLHWTDRRSQSTFRSVLELLYLITSALEEAGKTDDANKSNTAD